MAVYDKDTVFYFLQISENYFDDDAIAWLEEQPNGEKYSNFYLKLCLKSLKTEGILIRKVGEKFLPHTAESLKNLTKTKDIDTVKVAMNLLLEIGLVKVMESGAYYLSDLEKLIGKRSLGALKKQRQRLLKEQQEKNKLISP